MSQHHRCPSAATDLSRPLTADGTCTEIVPPERIVLLHGESRDDPDAFVSTLTLRADGAATRVERRTVFRTRQLRDQAVAESHAVEGGEQTLGNLAAYVAEVTRDGA